MRGDAATPAGSAPRQRRVACSVSDWQVSWCSVTRIWNCTLVMASPPACIAPGRQAYPQDTLWMRKIQEFTPDELPSYGPATDEDATVWYLEQLYKGQDPRTHPARALYFPAGTWGERLAKLEHDELISWQGSQLVLTETGRSNVQRRLYNEVERPERLPFVVVAGPMASAHRDGLPLGDWHRTGLQQPSVSRQRGTEPACSSEGRYKAVRIALPAHFRAGAPEAPQLPG